MKEYIDFNTRLRTAARNDFEKDFYKLMNNSVFGKTMENIRRHRNIKLVNNKEEYLKTVMKPNFKSGTLLGDDLMGSEMGKVKVIMNKPVYLGQAILDLSKIIMYEFHYDYMVPKYGKNIKLSTRLYDKRDDFDFHIVNFPFLSSNIPSGPSYGVYISQLIRYARCCSHYDDFRYRHKCLVDRLLSQGYKALRLEKSFKKFYGRYQDLIEKYRRSVNAMVSDSFPGQFLFNM